MNAYLIILHLLTLGFAYHRSPCTYSARKQFQFEHCYAPNLNPDLTLSKASFVMSHNSATGYLNERTNNNNAYQRAGTKDEMKTAVTNRVLGLYGKTQVGSVYEQLNNGARALDLRPKIYANESIGFHHGDLIDIPLTSIDLAALIEEVKIWCNDNPHELVLIFHSELVHELGYSYLSSTVETDDGYLYSGISAMKQVYKVAAVPYYSCEELSNLTVADAMDLADLSLFGGQGYLLAVDRHDMYASFCGKANWAQNELVTCYSSEDNNQQTNTFIQCTDLKRSGQYKLSALQSYARASTNNEPSDSSNELGPPANTYWYPFNQIQGFWQVDATSVQIGLMHGSTLLDDNRLSKVNQEMVRMAYNEEFNYVSLFSIDNVALNGLALFSVLRNACGQSTIDTDEEVPPCGKDLSMPRMRLSRTLPILWHVALCLVYGIMLTVVIVMVVPAFRLRNEGPQDHRLVCNGQIV